MERVHQRCGNERRLGPVEMPPSPAVGLAPAAVEVGVIVIPAPSSEDKSSRRSPLCTESCRAWPNDRRTSSVSCQRRTSKAVGGFVVSNVLVFFSYQRHLGGKKKKNDISSIETRQRFLLLTKERSTRGYPSCSCQLPI